MRRALVRGFTAFPWFLLTRANCRQLFAKLGDLLGELHHDLVLLGAVPLQVGIAFLQMGQAVGVTHPTHGSRLRGLRQSTNFAR